MGKKINIGLIGVGRLGSMYADFISHRVPGARLAAVADIIPDRAKTAAEKFDVPRWYDNHHDLCSDQEIDAVVITATTINHKQIIIDAAKAKKPTFCEKPMTLSLADCREAQQAVARAGNFFQMGFQRRFDKGFAAAKEKIDAGVIGQPIVFRGSSRDPYPPKMEYLKPANSGGQIIDMAVHDVDVARWYMGEVATAYAIGTVMAYPEIKEVGDTDNVIMAMTFDSSALGEIDISRNGVYGYDIRAEVLGTKGAIQAGYLRETPILIMTESGITHDVVPYFPQRFGDAYVNQLNNFLGNLAGQRQPLVTIDDGIKAIQICVAANHSLHAGGIARVKDF